MGKGLRGRSLLPFFEVFESTAHNFEIIFPNLVNTFQLVNGGLEEEEAGLNFGRQRVDASIDVRHEVSAGQRLET